MRAAVLDFGCVAMGGEAWRTVEIANSAAAEAHFQFDLDAAGHSVFSVDPPCGTLPGHSRLTLRLRFRPQHPIAHHRRAPCLLLHGVGLARARHSPDTTSSRHYCNWHLSVWWM